MVTPPLAATTTDPPHRLTDVQHEIYGYFVASAAKGPVHSGPSYPPST